MADERSVSDKLRDQFLNQDTGDAIEETAPKVKDTDKPVEVKGEPSPELTDDELVAQLRKRGITVSEVESLADIKQKLQAPLTDEERDQQARVVRADKIKFAIANNLGTVEEIAQWEKDSDEDEEKIAFLDFRKEQKKLDKNLSDDQIKSRFERYYHQGVDPDLIEDDDERTEVLALKEIGQNRIKAKGVRKKEEIKSRLNTIDSRYNEFNRWQKKALAFKNVVEDYATNDVDGTFTFDYEVGEEKIPITAKLGNKDDVQKVVRDYFLNTQAGVQIIAAGKTDKQTLKTYIDSYLWANPIYRTRIANAIGQFEKSQGIKEAKVGTNGAIKHPEREMLEGAINDPMVLELQNRLKST